MTDVEIFCNKAGFRQEMKSKDWLKENFLNWPGGQNMTRSGHLDVAISRLFTLARKNAHPSGKFLGFKLHFDREVSTSFVIRPKIRSIHFFAERVAVP